MKKLNSSRTKNFKFVRLYLDDLKSIYDIFKNNCKSFEVIADNNLIENFEEFKDLKNSIKNFSISAYDPHYIHLNFDRFNAILHINDDCEENLGFFEKIKEIIENRQSKIRFFINKYTPTTILIIYFATARYYTLPNIFDWLIFSLVVLIIIFSLMFTIFRNSYIIPEYKSTNFIKRNKDQILVSSFAAIIGAIIGSILTILFTK